MNRRWPACLLAVCLAGAPAVLLGAVPAAAASVIYVATTGTDAPGCGASTAPCATIPFAYAEALPGDTIRVAAGTYTFAAVLAIRKPDLHFEGNKAGVDARSRSPGGPGETVLEPSSGSSLFGMWRVYAGGVSIDGFTFANNTGGPAILTSDLHSGYAISDDIFSRNSSALRPGSDGITRSVFADNVFFDNGSGVFTPEMFRNAVFADSKFEGDGSSPINLTLGSRPGDRSVGVTIAGNDMPGATPVSLTGASDVLVTRNNMVGGFSGVQLTGDDHAIDITDNTIADKTHGGILISAVHAAVTNTAIMVAGNAIEHTASVEGRFGIEISRSSGVTVRDNLILDSGHDGIGFTTRDQPVASSDATIEQNTIAGSGGAGILVRDHAYTGLMTVRFNRIVDSVSGHGLVNDAVNDGPDTQIDARLNWWGCNSMPRGAGCDHLAGAAIGRISFAPWLVLSIGSEPSDILAGQHATIVASLQRDSSGGTPGGPFFKLVLVTFTAGPGKVTPGQVLTNALLHARTHWPGGQPRPVRICASADHQTECLHFGAVSPSPTPSGSPAPRPTPTPVVPILPVTGAPMAGLLGAGISLVGIGLLALASSQILRRRSRLAAMAGRRR